MVMHDDRGALRRFLVEVDFPGAAVLDAHELSEVARRTGCAVDRLAPGIRWEGSELAADRLFGRYLARDEVLLQQHLLEVGLPGARITPIVAVIDGSAGSRAARR
jgi:hypothetical protein